MYAPRIECNVVERTSARQLVNGFLGPRPHPVVVALVDGIDDIAPTLLDAPERAIQFKKGINRGA